jgi:hypothetical protein
MEYRELAKLIPDSYKVQFAEELTDILLKSEKREVPPHIAKSILHYMQRDQLHSQAGLTHLIEAVAMTEPESLAIILDDFELQNLAKAFSPIWDKQF